jgi:hypothetical protein
MQELGIMVATVLGMANIVVLLNYLEILLLSANIRIL